MGQDTVYNAFLYAAEHYAERPFLHIPASSLKQNKDVDYLYSEMLTEVQALIKDYTAIGVGAGDRVAILLENRADFFIHWFALNSLNVSVVPVNGEMQIEEIAYLLDNSDSRLVVTLAHKQALLEEAIAESNLSIAIVTNDQVSSAKLPEMPQATSGAIGGDAECAMLYTSGSTGKPKGCILTNDYFVLSGAWYRDAPGYCQLEKGKERLITPLPLVHMNAMACSTMGMVMTGGCLIQLDRFHPRTWWKDVRNTGATVLHYLGVMPAILLNIETDGDEDFSKQVKFGFGAGVNPKHHAVFEERFGFPLIESWGMTETGARNCITAFHEPRHVGTSCIGKASDTLDIKLVDGDGNEVAQGEPGELLVKAKGDNPRLGFFSGYYKNQEATDEAWEGGWLHTGDVLRMGDDGSYHFVDRIKNVIRRSGENISALEVEANLSLNKSIAQVAVTAVPDEIRGDEVIACIILDQGFEPSEATANDIFNSSAESLVYYKLPGYIVFVEDMPLTASNKPQRAEIKKLARTIVDNIDNESQCFDLRKMKRK